MPPELKALYERISALLQAATNPQDPTFVGDPYRDELNQIRGQVLASLGTASAASGSNAQANVELLKPVLSTLEAVINSLAKVVKAKSDEKATALASLTDQVNAAVKTKTDAGELIPKETATQLAATARTEGESAGFAKGKKLADRQKALAAAGLPAEVSSDAPDSVLLADDAAFTAARDAAKDRVTKLTGIGLAVASATVRSLAWGKQEDFDRQLAAFTEVATASMAKTGSARSSAAAKVNPLAGAGAGAGTDKPKLEMSAMTIIC